MKVSNNLFPLGDFKLRSGEILPHAILGFRTWGSLSNTKDNAIILPSYYSGTFESYIPWIASGSHQIFNPNKSFIIAYDQFGAGLSSKPSSCCSSLDQWPRITIEDNVNAAKQLIDYLGVKKVKLVMGWSMGGMQVFSWLNQYPCIIQNALALCATPLCNPYNYVFLEGIREILRHPDEKELRLLSVEEQHQRLSTFGKAYAGWAYSEDFFLKKEYVQFGYHSPKDLLISWANDHAAMNIEDLLAQIYTWENSYIPRTNDTVHPPKYTCTDNYGTEGFSSHSPSIIAMPCSTDRYFSPASLKNQLKQLQPNQINNVKTIIMNSTLGHIAGRPGIRTQETDQIRAALAQFQISL